MINDNRQRLIDMINILFYETDESHALDTYEIIDRLEMKGHSRPDRKTIDPIIQFMINDLDLDIIKDAGKPNRYRWISRNFDLAELKLLVDAVQSSRFISAGQSDTIISKLKKLTSSHLAKSLDRPVVTPEGFKRSSKRSIYSIDAITEAMRFDAMISFEYVDYDTSKKEVSRHDGMIYEVSPYGLLWNNDYYYLLGSLCGEETVRTFRVDRMKNSSVLSEKEAAPKPQGFSLERYSSRVFDMFSGTPAEIRVRCKPYIMNYLIDRLGMDFLVESVSEDGAFIADIVVDASPTFYAWVFQFGGDMQILSPSKVIGEFNAMLNSFGTPGKFDE